MRSPIHQALCTELVFQDAEDICRTSHFDILIHKQILSIELSYSTV